MDFSLLNKDESFDFSQYFQPIIDEFDAIGRRVDIQKKDKKNFGKVESAFLKIPPTFMTFPFKQKSPSKSKLK